jgi:hypothetical protein
MVANEGVNPKGRFDTLDGEMGGGRASVGVVVTLYKDNS